jgi:hypothetical protein
MPASVAMEVGSWMRVCRIDSLPVTTAIFSHRVTYSMPAVMMPTPEQGRYLRLASLAHPRRGSRTVIPAASLSRAEVASPFRG